MRDTANGPIKGITSPNGRWIKFTYTNNVITQAVDNAGRTVTYTYDASNRLQSVTDPNNGVTTYIWDSTNNRGYNWGQSSGVDP